MIYGISEETSGSYNDDNDDETSMIPSQPRELFLQQPRQSAIIITQTRQSERPPRPILAKRVFRQAIELDGLIERLDRDPLELFRGIEDGLLQVSSVVAGSFIKCSKEEKGGIKLELPYRFRVTCDCGHLFEEALGQLPVGREGEEEEASDPAREPRNVSVLEAARGVHYELDALSSYIRASKNGVPHLQIRDHDFGRVSIFRQGDGQDIYSPSLGASEDIRISAKTLYACLSSHCSYS